jgi:hypothetical protein
MEKELGVELGHDDHDDEDEVEDEKPGGQQ